MDASLASWHAVTCLAGVHMPYSGLMPSIEAIQQALREPLSRAPHDHNGFAIYIFERAREIDHEHTLAKKLAQQNGQWNGTGPAIDADATLDCSTRIQ